jgi:hypothetical protein
VKQEPRPGSIKTTFFTICSLTKKTLSGRISLRRCFFGWAVSFVTTLILSHKLAGPIVRLKWYFQQIAKTGHAKPVHFKKSNFMQDLPPIINQALQKLESGEKEKRKSA